jgi:hypothetical protein
MEQILSAFKRGDKAFWLKWHIAALELSCVFQGLSFPFRQNGILENQIIVIP